MVHQTKKSSKFDCKICGEKQSIKRHYGIGTAKDCRLHVQRLNEFRAEIDELKESKGSDSDEENSPLNHVVQSRPEATKIKRSKWSDYVDEKDEEGSKHENEWESISLNNTEMVLEMPKKCRNISFKCPNLKTVSTTFENINASTSYSDEVKSSSTKQLQYCRNISNKEPTIEIQKFISPLIATKKVIKESVPPAVNSNSKWAQFVEEEREEVSDDENLFLKHRNFREFSILEAHAQCVNEDEALDINSRKSQELFALCKDSELDNVLEI